MNSIDRIKAAVNFKTPDRVPVIAQVFAHAAIHAGATIREYIQNGELLASCQLQALKYYGYDAVFSVMDVSVETEALGSVLTYRENQYPYIQSYAFSPGSNINALSVPNPNQDGRMPQMLKAINILNKEVGKEVLVVGCVLGPMTVITQLMGMEKALYLAIDDHAQFARLLDFAVEVVICFGTAQIESGAHLPVVFDPAASSAVIPPQFFREFELPRLKRVFTALKSAGAIANWLHIAGPVESILSFYPQAGVDIANFDYCVDPHLVQEKLLHTCLDGNIKPLSFVEDTPENIAARSSELKSIFAQRCGWILSSGCEIPPESKPENIMAMVSAVHR